MLYVFYKVGNKWVSENKNRAKIKKTEHGSAVKAFRTGQSKNPGSDMIIVDFLKQGETPNMAGFTEERRAE